MRTWLKANGGPLAIVVLGIGIGGFKNQTIGLVLIVVGVCWLFVVSWKPLAQHFGLGADAGLTTWIRAIVKDGVSFYRPSGDVWLALLQHVEITNPSPEQISVNVTLHIRSAERWHYFCEHDEPSLLSDAVKAETPLVNWLQCPLHIEPHRTVTGSFGFVLDFWPIQDDTPVHPDEVRLEIGNNITGNSALMPVPGRYPAEDEGGAD